MSKSLARLLIFCGISTLVAAAGTVVGRASDRPAAEPNKEAAQQVVEANSRFALDLYQRLALENKGKNLLFSPLSISSALTMTAEGARSETAIEMGTVLRFPQQTRRVGEGAQLIPWETSLIHAGMASLNEGLIGERHEIRTKQSRARSAVLRRELAATRQRIARLQTAPNWQQYKNATNAQRQIVARLNAEVAKVDQYEIRVANALWGEQTFQFRQDFIDTVSTYCRTGGFSPVDFIRDHNAARRRINQWVESQTNDRIRDLISKKVLNTRTRLVLTNAIYFKGDWAEPFKLQHTKNQDFRLTGGNTIKTPLMAAYAHKAARYAAFNADGSFFKSPQMVSLGQKGLYPDAGGFAMVELPYGGDKLSMVVIASNRSTGLLELEAQLTAENLATWIGHLEQRQTNVFLPKFKLETMYTLGSGGPIPSGALPKMGMTRAFTEPRAPNQGAQFGGMCSSDNAIDQLYITKALHKAFLEVNEEGTEATAATAVVMNMTSAAPTVPFIPTFKADRPFVFLIRDRATGSILFLGRMMVPE